MNLQMLEYWLPEAAAGSAARSRKRLPPPAREWQLPAAMRLD
jgi:hypothetical protein